MNGNVPTSSDLNDYIDFCTKRANFGIYTNKPDTMQSGNGWGVLMVYKVDNNTVVQIIYNESHRRIHYRHWYDGVWQTWDNQELNIPDFYKDYANLGALASALGGFNIVLTPQYTDFDTIRTNGFHVHITDGSTNPVNLPSDYDWGLVFVIGHNNSNVAYQIAYDLKKSICKGRSYNQEGTALWSPWRNIISV